MNTEWMDVDVRACFDVCATVKEHFEVKPATEDLEIMVPSVYTAIELFSDLPGLLKVKCDKRGVHRSKPIQLVENI